MMITLDCIFLSLPGRNSLYENNFYFLEDFKWYIGPALSETDNKLLENSIKNLSKAKC